MYAIRVNKNTTSQVQIRTHPVRSDSDLVGFFIGDSHMKRIKVNTGDRFGRWTVVEESQKRKDKRYIVCKCECGNESTIMLGSLRVGDSQSCGCLQKELAVQLGRKSLKHGKSGTRLYHIWADMKGRCGNPNSNNYANYGLRGINLCKQWVSFACFMRWAMKNGYTNSLTIERIDNDGNYTPKNCTWITKGKQIRNQRRSHRITYKGRTQIVIDWCKELGIGKETLLSRLNLGWSVERTFETPVRTKFRNKRGKK